MNHDMPDTCSGVMVNFIEWLVETNQLMDAWEWIKYPLEKPYNFYEQYIKFQLECSHEWGADQDNDCNCCIKCGARQEIYTE